MNYLYIKRQCTFTTAIPQSKIPEVIAKTRRIKYNIIQRYTVVVINSSSAHVTAGLLLN